MAVSRSTGVVVGVHRSGTHEFSKSPSDRIVLVSGHGVEADAHYGMTVQHRSRVVADPTKPNLRQVHLIHDELLVELRDRGFDVRPGALGENITTHGLDLLSLSRDTRIAIGSTACLQVTGLRNPCRQIDTFLPGLLAAVLQRGPAGELIRKCGIMAIVLDGGEIEAGDPIRVISCPEIHIDLDVV